MFNSSVYLELNDNYLLLSKVKGKRDKLFLSHIENIQLANLEFKKGILYNPSALFLFIQKFLKTNKLKSPKAIVSLTSFCANDNETHQNLNTLQICLSLCKAGLMIKKIINSSLVKKEDQMSFSNYFYKKDLENQLDFFKPFTQEQKKYSTIWAWSYLLILCCLFTTLVIIQTNKNQNLKILQTQNYKLLEANKILEEKITLAHTLKKNNFLIKQKIEKLQPHQKTAENLQNILTSIARQIPPFCTLVNMKMSTQKMPKQKDESSPSKCTLLKIDGVTSNQLEISQLLQNISQNNVLANLKISKIQKIKFLEVKNDQNPQKNVTLKPSISFQITGIIKK